MFGNEIHGFHKYRKQPKDVKLHEHTERIREIENDTADE